MADSFRKLVAEVVGKYPAYQQILTGIRNEHNNTKATLNDAKNSIQNLHDLSKEYVATLNSIKQATQRIEHSALRHSKDSESHAGASKHYKDESKNYRDEIKRHFVEIQSAIQQLNRIASDYEKLNMHEIVITLLNSDNNFNIALSRVLGLLTSDENFIKARNEVLSNVTSMLDDMKYHSNLALDLYSDTKDLLGAEKISIFSFLGDCKKLLDMSNKALAQSNELLTKNANVYLAALKDEWIVGENAIENAQKYALARIEDLGNKKLANIKDNLKSFEVIEQRARGIVDDSKALSEITKNYAFAQRVREFSVMTRLYDALNCTHRIQSQSQKALLHFTQYSAHEAKVEAQGYKEQCEVMQSDIKNFSNSSMQFIVTQKEEAQDAFKKALFDMQSIKTQSIKETKDITEEFKQKTIDEVQAIKENIENFSVKMSEWIEAKTHFMFIHAHLKGAGFA